MVILTTLAPQDIIGIAYDSGGATTSTITVPLVTALGVGLAQAIKGRNPMIDGFGLIAFASLMPIIFVLIFGVVTVRDIAAKVVIPNRSAVRTSVDEIMTKPALTISGDMTVKYAVRLLARLRRTRALVVGDKGLLGLVTLRDLVLGHDDGGEPTG